MNTPPTESGHSETARSIWVFTPSRTAPEDLEAILVQRHDLLKDAVERVRESALTAHKHHLLFVGPRGCGKTHLVTLIVSRISADDEASAHLRLAWLNEDETCTSLLELLIKIHTALEKRYPEFRAEDLSQAYELKPDAAFEFVAKHLLKTLASKTLVVVTENLDALFESMGEAGQKQLRAFIQEHPQLAIVATAQRLVEDLSDRTSPFFGFFQTEHLKPLSIEQATTLLQNIAHRQGKKEVGDFLTTSRGRSRVRALHHLSGGNHRIYIVLSQFITRESMDALIGPFLKMVDELTPYYQERIRWLPPLQRKIVEMLCTCETTVPVKEIARRLFSTPQTISSQLQSLREKGYVESNQRGREFLYEISEPLMRICVEVKENQTTQPLRLLVDFLRVWYDDVELEQRLGLCQPESPSCHYLTAALERNGTEGNLRMKMLVNDLLENEDPPLDSGALKKLEVSFPEELLLAAHCQKDGDIAGAFRCMDEALVGTTNVSAKARILFFRGLLHAQEGSSAAAIADYTRVIELPGAPTDQMSMALVNRGIAHDTQGDSVMAIEDYTHVIEMLGAPSDEVAKALVNRGIAHNKQGDSAKAVADFTQAIQLPNAPTKQVEKALVNRGFERAKQGDCASAILDFSHILDRPDIHTDAVSLVLVMRGSMHSQQGNYEEAIADFTRIVELGDLPPDHFANALRLRGDTHQRQGDSANAIADYTRVIDFPAAPPNALATALLNRGLTHAQQGNSAAEIADYTRVIELPDAPPDQAAKAYYHRAVRAFQSGDKSGSRRDLESVISLAGTPSDQIIEAHLALAELHFSEGRWNEGFAAIESGLRLGAQQSPPCFAAPVDLIAVLFSAGLSQEGRRTHADALYARYAEHGTLSVLGEALVKHLGGLFAKGEPWPASDNLEQWQTAWEQAADDAPEFKLPLRLLRTGIDFIKSGGNDPDILLNLTSPERSILRQALGFETAKD